MRIIKGLLILLMTFCLVGCNKEEEHEHEYEKGICECGEIKEGYYKVTFKSDGGSKVKSQIVKKGNLVTMPNTPTKDGCDFDGWYLDGTLFDFNKEVTKNITLTAKWYKKTDYRISRYDSYTEVQLELYDYDNLSLEFDFGPLNDIIAPGTAGEIVFKISNLSDVSLVYNLELICEVDFLTFEVDQYLFDPIEDGNKIKITNDFLDPNEYKEFIIFWSWDFNGDDSIDTEIGADLSEIKMSMNLEYEQRD